MADKFEIQTEPTPEEEEARSPSTTTASGFVGPVARGLSQSLMQGAFEKFGRAFTDTGDVRADAASADGRLAPWRAAGAKTAGALELRWHTMEYENFQASAVEPYIAAKKEMLGKYKQLHSDLDSGLWAGPPGPDGQPQIQQLDVTDPAQREQLMRLRGQIEKDFYGQNADMDIELYNLAHKYPGNPLIGERIKMIATSYSNQLMKATNPDQSLQAEGAASEVTARMMAADTNKLQAQANLKNAGAKALKEPTGLRQVRKHPEIGPAGAQEWLVGSKEGEAFLFGHRGGDAMRDATNHYEQQLIIEDPSLADDPDKLQIKLRQQHANIRNLAAAGILKELAPDMYTASKEATPWLFDFEKAGEDGEGILGANDKRAWKGDRRPSEDKKEELFEGWSKQWEKELDDWASRPENAPDPDAALEHMEAWIRDAIANGAPGVPHNLTIVINDNTKALRKELIESLIRSGRANVLRNKHIRAAHPIQGLLEGVTSQPFGGRHKTRGGRFGRSRRAKARREGLNLDESN